MRWATGITRTVLLAAAAATALILAWPNVGRAEDDEARTIHLAVIVDRDSPLKKLSRHDLYRVFTSQRVTDPDGRKLIPFNHPPRTPDRVGFDRAVLRMSPEEVGNFWVDRKIRGKPGPPRTVRSISMLRRVVARFPGAIGYVRPKYLNEHVRAIRVDGKLPGEDGYPVAYRR